MQNIPVKRLQNHVVEAIPLRQTDFEELFAAANDPLIWEQHPNPDRYKREVFENYFRGAMLSGGAFIIKDAQTGETIGSSRYSDHDAAQNSVHIGYTFFVRSHWGTGHNHALKKLMLAHAFNYVDKVIFLIGAVNKRSQVSIERLGAKKTGEKETAYFGEAPKTDFVYEITKADFNTWS